MTTINQFEIFRLKMVVLVVIHQLFSLAFPSNLEVDGIEF